MKKCFTNFISFLIYEWNWVWLHYIISTLCDLEMGWKMVMDEQWRSDIEAMDITVKARGTCDWQENIPKDSLYCEGCPYKDHSVLADFFFGSQCNGYCWFLGKGDYSFIRPTELIWDGCKDCGMYLFGDDIEEPYIRSKDKDNQVN